MSTLERIQIIKPKVLVAEGKHEESFFEALMLHLSLSDIQVLPVGGKYNIRQNIKALSISPDFAHVTSLGIIRDADEDPAAAFQSVCAALRDAKLPVPQRPLATAGSKPKVAVMILPREDSHGMLEDVCLEAVASDPAIPCLERYFRCLEEHRLCLPSGCSLSKARVQAFLASRPDTDMWLGLAAKKGYWPWQNRAFDPLKAFLRQI